MGIGTNGKGCLLFRIHILFRIAGGADPLGTQQLGRNGRKGIGSVTAYHIAILEILLNAPVAAVGEELRPVFLTGDCHADSVFCHSDGAVTHKPVKSKPRNMQHIRGFQPHDCTLDCRRIVRADRVFVVELAVPVTVHRHPVRHQRIKGNDLALAVTDDLGVGVAPEEKMGHERFPKHERTHFRVWLIVQKQIQRMVDGLFLAAILLVTVEVERQSRHSLRQDTDAGIYRRHLHGGAFIDPFARRAAAKEKTVGAARSAVLRLIPGTEKP